MIRVTDDTISRKAVLQVLPRSRFNSDDAYFEALYEIEHLPTVDAVPRKQGYWVRWYEEIHDSFGVVFEPHCKCSECEMEYDPYYANTVNYCSHCGARIEVKNAIN